MSRILEILGVDKEQFNGIVRSCREAIHKSVNYTALHTLARVKINAPKDHGRLAGSFQLHKDDDLTYRVFTKVKYALMVNNGTGEYGPNKRPITPKNGEYLVFNVGGKTIFTKEVKGQKPNPYIDNSISETKSRVQEFIEKAIQEVA
ncbi:HK97 gp10 family phage protein [Bacillus coahuilensis]|uniref:HK97 gp10 family phage protein n=1 Tax=Bacillus coahuilensis TaxID=408580 RepID=UPI0001851317|nr:HK97 gp10 family phage protein [Bacillus coahuilensis]